MTPWAQLPPRCVARVDAFKLTAESRRPLPMGAQDIGTWCGGPCCEGVRRPHSLGSAAAAGGLADQGPHPGVDHAALHYDQPRPHLLHVHHPGRAPHVAPPHRFSLGGGVRCVRACPRLPALAPGPPSVAPDAPAPTQHILLALRYVLTLLLDDVPRDVAVQMGRQVGGPCAPAPRGRLVTRPHPRCRQPPTQDHIVRRVLNLIKGIPEDDDEEDEVEATHGVKGAFSPQHQPFRASGYPEEWFSLLSACVAVRRVPQPCPALTLPRRTGTGRGGQHNQSRILLGHSLESWRWAAQTGSRACPPHSRPRTAPRHRRRAARGYRCSACPAWARCHPAWC